jgi:hypothetical protein
MNGISNNQDFRFEGLNQADAQVVSGFPGSNTAAGANETMSSKIWRYTTSPVGAGLLTMLFIFGILLGIKPPFIQKTPTLNDRESTGIRWIPVAVWSFLSGILVILIQPMSNLCQSMMGPKNNESSNSHSSDNY